jgi:type IV pilus assembly protein PilC
MSLYSYKAVDSDGRTIRGKLPADSEAELESKLKQSGLDVISVSEVKNLGLFSFFSKIDIKEIILVCIHLYHLEKAGVPILDSIADLRDTSENVKVKQIMMDIYDALKNGKLLSEALAKHPLMFDNIFIGLMKAGEKTGNFADVFFHLEHHYEWVAELRKKIKKAISYPIFLLLLMCGVVSIMMIFVIPKLTVFLEAQNIPLPMYTIALMKTSKFIQHFWWVLLALPIITFALVRLGCASSKKFAYNVDLFKLHMPIMGTVLRKIEIARFCHFFAIMYKSGIGILECLDVSLSIVQNLVLRESIAEIRHQVSEGKKITMAIADSKQFPVLVIRMFKVGEESGNLDQAMNNINMFYDAEINASIEAMVGVLQPLLTFVMGGLLMWITAAVFGPVYGSFGVKK